MKTLKKAGGNLFLQSLDQLAEQNPVSFSSLNTVGGEVDIVTIPNLVSLNGLSLLSRVRAIRQPTETVRWATL